MYGLTECKRVSYLPPDQIDIRPDSVGRGMPNEEVYIVDEAGNRVGPGVVGELVVRGSNVMKGYWNMPEETDRVLRPGPLPYERVLYTGDLFRADAEGYLLLRGTSGRHHQMPLARRWSPREVENVSLYDSGSSRGGSDRCAGQDIKERPSARSWWCAPDAKLMHAKSAGFVRCGWRSLWCRRWSNSWHLCPNLPMARSTAGPTSRRTANGENRPGSRTVLRIDPEAETQRIAHEHHRLPSRREATGRRCSGHLGWHR